MWYDIALFFVKSSLSSRRRGRSHRVHQLSPWHRDQHHGFWHVCPGPPPHRRSSPCIYLLLCLELINSSGTQAIIKWQSYDSIHHAVPRLAGREKYYIIEHLIQTHCKSWRLYHITCTLCKNKLDRYLHGLLQVLSWLISRLHANVLNPRQNKHDTSLLLV